MTCFSRLSRPACCLHRALDTVDRPARCDVGRRLRQRITTLATLVAATLVAAAAAFPSSSPLALVAAVRCPLPPSRPSSRLHLASISPPSRLRLGLRLGLRRRLRHASISPPSRLRLRLSPPSAISPPPRLRLPCRLRLRLASSWPPARFQLASVSPPSRLHLASISPPSEK